MLCWPHKGSCAPLMVSCRYYAGFLATAFYSGTVIASPVLGWVFLFFLFKKYTSCFLLFPSFFFNHYAAANVRLLIFHPHLQWKGYFLFFAFESNKLLHIYEPTLTLTLPPLWYDNFHYWDLLFRPPRLFILSSHLSGMPFSSTWTYIHHSSTSYFQF